MPAAAGALLIERGDRLGADHLAARGVHRGKRDIAVDHAQCVLDHLAAVVDLGDNSISPV